jgi:hypothetical protein
MAGKSDYRSWEKSLKLTLGENSSIFQDHFFMITINIEVCIMIPIRTKEDAEFPKKCIFPFIHPTMQMVPQVNFSLVIFQYSSNYPKITVGSSDVCISVVQN